MLFVLEPLQFYPLGNAGLYNYTESEEHIIFENVFKLCYRLYFPLSVDLLGQSSESFNKDGKQVTMMLQLSLAEL